MGQLQLEPRWGSRNIRRFIKNQSNREIRRQAKRDPENAVRGIKYILRGYFS